MLLIQKRKWKNKHKRSSLSLRSSHEEDDSRILFGTNKCRYKNRWYWCLDYRSLQHSKTVSRQLEVGVYTKNTYIVNELYQHLGTKLCNALPGYHAFVGCDFTASFIRKGKISVINIFGELGNTETVNETQLREMEKFVCDIYGKVKLSSADG